MEAAARKLLAADPRAPAGPPPAAGGPGSLPNQAGAYRAGALSRVGALFFEADASLLRRPRVQRSVNETLELLGARGGGGSNARAPLLTRYGMACQPMALVCGVPS